MQCCRRGARECGVIQGASGRGEKRRWVLSKPSGVPTLVMASTPAEMGAEEESNHKALLRCTISFIKELCNMLDLQLLPQCTALVYCHRFVAVQGFKEHDRWVLGCACVFLAAKVEEDMRKLDAVVGAAMKLHDFKGVMGPKDSSQSASSDRKPDAATPGGESKSADDLVKSNTSGSATALLPERDRQTLRNVREKVLLYERVLLHNLSFDVSVSHPHLQVVAILKKLRSTHGNGPMAQFRQVAWNFVNDGLYTNLCVRFGPGDIAAAAVLMAYSYLKKRQVDLNDYSKQVIIAVEQELETKRLKLFSIPTDHCETIFREIYSVYDAAPPFVSSTEKAASSSSSLSSSQVLVDGNDKEANAKRRASESLEEPEGSNKKARAD